jgi:hypothetical protein
VTVDTKTVMLSRREPPVIFGHYCLDSKKPRLLDRNAACVDYCVAKGGFLAAYTWSGEKQLNGDHFAMAKVA